MGELGDLLLPLLPSCGTGERIKKRPAVAEGKVKGTQKATKTSAGTDKGKDEKTQREPETKQDAKAVETTSAGIYKDVTVDGKKFRVTMMEQGAGEDVKKKNDKLAEESRGEKEQTLAEESSGEKEQTLAEESSGEKQQKLAEESNGEKKKEEELGEPPKKKKHAPKDSFCFVWSCCELFVS